MSRSLLICVSFLGEAKEEADCDDGSEDDVRWVWDEGSYHHHEFLLLHQNSIKIIFLNTLLHRLRQNITNPSDSATTWAGAPSYKLFKLKSSNLI